MTVREELEERLGANPVLDRRRSRFGDGYSYFLASREIAHFHGDGRLDIRLTRQRIRELKGDGALDPRVRTRGPSADWATVPLEGPQDLSLALEMIDEAVRANG